jgi:hypothetical protein
MLLEASTFCGQHRAPVTSIGLEFIQSHVSIQINLDYYIEALLDDISYAVAQLGCCSQHLLTVLFVFDHDGGLPSSISSIKSPFIIFIYVFSATNICPFTAFCGQHLLAVLFVFDHDGGLPSSISCLCYVDHPAPVTRRRMQPPSTW